MGKHCSISTAHETITSTTTVTRTFDDANRLEISTDGSGSTTYSYDDNYNLTTITPPGSAAVTGYGYNQRNLMITSTLNSLPLADFVYDGQGNRLQQIDYSGTNTTTITYTNDIFGLTQVLVADDGTGQVYNLFGLDLISQDDGNEVRSLLVDALGSVRLEMVGQAVETATIYDPYGKVLAQTGMGASVYGFTGEQEDSATGLLYLRARYYNPALKSFMSRDPWEGTGWRPVTLNYYTYVHSNPVNYIDPTGLRIEDETPIFGQYYSGWTGTGLFSYTRILGDYSLSGIYYLLVDYQLPPWGRYATPTAPAGSVLVPVRHPLNLRDENPACGISVEAATNFYMNGGFANWEVNARDILSEIHGVVSSQQEWALRDAIGIAYNPYNRSAYNQLPVSEREVSFAGGTLDIKALLLSTNQYAVTTAYSKALNPGDALGINARPIYEFSLIVALGVDRQYFYDTSYGATNFVHRPPNTQNYLDCGQVGPAFFYSSPESFPRYNFALTSTELAARGGWPEDLSELERGPSQWVTPYPPTGCVDK